MREQTEGNNAGHAFITVAVSFIQQIKTTSDRNARDNHKIVLGHAYLPLPCICLTYVCARLFLPGTGSQTNNEGQTIILRINSQLRSDLIWNLLLSTQPQSPGLVCCRRISKIELWEVFLLKCVC